MVSTFSEKKCIQLPGEKRADGTFSSIIELKVSGTGEKVVGKVFKINPLDTDQLLGKVEVIFKEIETISNLKNENIVMSKGLCFLPDRIMPVLLMERMTSSLQSYIQHHTSMSLSMEERIRVLQQTANGLNYLHSLKPTFVHGRLTTKNILLDDTMMTAKIGGFYIESLPQIPVPAEYLPPEAQGGSQSSDPSVDVFSFGHLALVTILQEEVVSLPSSQSFNEAGEPSVVHEVKRRAKYLEKAQMLTTETKLLENINECLKNNPKCRPCTEKVLKTLQGTGLCVSVG